MNQNEQRTMMAILVAAVWLPITVVRGGTNERPIGFQPMQYIGYNQDGSGYIPDCTPVTTWNEWDFMKVPSGRKDARGNDILIEVPDKKNWVNIVWKAPHINWCNGGMIVAGGKLFAMSDRGGLGFYVDTVAEFAGAELFCYDPATGKQLWRTDLDHWDLAPGGEESRKVLLEYNRKVVEFGRAWHKFGYWVRNRGKFDPPLDDEGFRAMTEPILKFIQHFPRDLESFKGSPYDSGGYPFFHFRKVVERDLPELHKMYSKLIHDGYLRDPWAMAYDHLGLSMQTPVSDGKHIYVSTAYGAVFCVDMTGKIVWKKWFGVGFERGLAIPSPTLHGDLLVVHTAVPRENVREGRSTRLNGLPVRIAMNKKDGNEVWRVVMPVTGRNDGNSADRVAYMHSPVAFSLPVADGTTDERVDALVFLDGQVLRLQDGFDLAKDLVAEFSGHAWSAWRDLLFVHANMISGGGNYVGTKNEFPVGGIVVRLKAESKDKVTAELVWSAKDQGMGNRALKTPAVRDGIAYGWVANQFQVRDALTGQLYASVITPVTPFHLAMLAGHHAVAVDCQGFGAVVAIGPDGKTATLAGTGRLGERVYGEETKDFRFVNFGYGQYPTASGNRIFIRSHTDLYCIGDPKEPMRLSAHHQAR